MEKTGGEGSNPKMSSITLTIRIDKSYGTIKSISAVENYTINRMGMEATAKSTLSFGFTYCQDYSSQIEKIETELK